MRVDQLVATLLILAKVFIYIIIRMWLKFIFFRKHRTTFDTSENSKKFGPVIDYTKVQSKVSLKYDSWHKEVLAKFGTFIGGEMAQFHTSLSKVMYKVQCLIWTCCFAKFITIFFLQHTWWKFLIPSYSYYFVRIH